MLRLAAAAVAHPRPWLIGVALSTAFLMAGLLRLELRTEGAALHPTESAVVKQSEADRLRFLEPRQIILLVSCQVVSGETCRPSCHQPKPRRKENKASPKPLRHPTVSPRFCWKNSARRS